MNSGLCDSSSIAISGHSTSTIDVLLWLYDRLGIFKSFNCLIFICFLTITIFAKACFGFLLPKLSSEWALLFSQAIFVCLTQSNFYLQLRPIAFASYCEPCSLNHVWFYEWNKQGIYRGALQLIPCLFHLWNEVTWIQICATLNHRKNMKAEPSRLIPQKPTENLELSIVSMSY